MNELNIDSHDAPEQPVPPPPGLGPPQHGRDIGAEGAQVADGETALDAQALVPGADADALSLERGVLAERDLGGRLQRPDVGADERRPGDRLLELLLLLLLLLLLVVLLLLLLLVVQRLWWRRGGGGRLERWCRSVVFH